MIRKEGEIYKIYNHDGTKVIGEYKTKEEAEKRLKQIEYFKYLREKLKKK